MLQLMKWAATIALLIVGTSPAQASILFFDIDADPAAWIAATSSFSPYTAYDFGTDPDYGISGFSAPLTSAGGGPVSAGNLATGVVMSVNNFGGTVPELVGVGPSISLGNPLNAVLANYFVDGFAIDFLTSVPVFQFNALTLLGTSGSVTITVTDAFGGVWSEIFVVGSGRNLGVVGTGIDLIAAVDIYDSTGDGAEGVQGFGGFGIGGPSGPNAPTMVPEPGSLTMFCLGAVGLVAGAIRRRRRTTITA